MLNKNCKAFKKVKCAILQSLLFGAAFLVSIENTYADPSGKKASAGSENSSNTIAGVDEKSNKDMEILISQPDIARRDPANIPQILTLVRKTIDGSEHPEYFNHVTLDIANALLDSAFAANNPQLQMEVINTYIAYLFPKTGIDGSLPKFVGRAMDIAEYNHNVELLAAINSTFFNAKTTVNYRKEQWLLQGDMLDYSYRLATLDSVYIDDYLWLSSQVGSDSKIAPDLPTTLATHYTRLLIKVLKAKDYKAGKKISKTYLDKIYPVTGYSGKSTDVISHIVVYGVISHDEQIANQVLRDFVENANYDRAKNQIFTFNIACYYATHNNKAKMLAAIKESISYGHDRESFLSDNDFSAFKADPEFRAAVGL